MSWPGVTHWIRDRYVVAVAIIVAAAALRAWPLQAMGTRMAWLTFYPAVMAAAVHQAVQAYRGSLTQEAP